MSNSTLKKPDYKKIYTDMINAHYPDKKQVCEPLLSKKELSIMEVIKINKLLIGGIKKESQKYKSYDNASIIEILDFQRMHGLNNSELANHFHLSRNTIARWKKMRCSGLLG
ncbi:helix-turn-helix domain-containing protein [Chryseobacterium pennipullorum]|uniref:Helix-turn-helix domain-containing protein n=1 Tax=Chryseobacterium pennipullorum TaxID=2258963 RepID=A0A3D9AVM7_9FLAO|nr:helix-turn-helix domain-containing protein [Chryseobacterium pennipullorum]REC45394.1 helix-turn-helix domain-containing protein [Chryseobacterium pennipullorum]